MIFKNCLLKKVKMSLLLPDFIVVELFHCCFGLLLIAESNKGISSVVAIKVHHHSDLVDLSKLKREFQ